MVDVGDKAETHRVARGRRAVLMQPETLDLIQEGRAAKGDVLGVAQVAAIMAAKNTHELIPMCHPLLLTRIERRLRRWRRSRPRVEITATVETRGQTGVEMEALTAVSRRGADRLRHGQGGRSRHDDRRHPPTTQVRRALRRLRPPLNQIPRSTRPTERGRVRLGARRDWRPGAR